MNTVFETLRWKQGKLEYLEEHVMRLQQGCKTLGITVNILKMKKKIEDEFSVQKRKQGLFRVRILVQDSEEGTLTIEPYIPLTKACFHDGVDLCSRPHPNPTMQAQVKMFPREGYHEALRAAETNGFQECLLYHENRILECSTANVVMVHDGVYVIPRDDDFRLQGIMEQMVCKRLPHVVKRDLPWPLPEGARLYITNSLRGLLPVKRIDDRVVEVCSNDYLYQLIPQFWAY